MTNDLSNAVRQQCEAEAVEALLAKLARAVAALEPEFPQTGAPR